MVESAVLALRVFDSHFNTLERTREILTDPTATPDERAKAAGEYAREFAPKAALFPANPKARRELRRQAKRQGLGPKELFRQLLEEGLLMASTQASKPQTVRLKRTWEKDESGKITRVRPANDLSDHKRFRWLTKEAFAAVEAILLDEAYPRVDERAASFVGDLEQLPSRDFDANPEDALIDLIGEQCDWPEHALIQLTEEVETISGELLHLLDKATPRQRDILQMMPAGVENKAEIARRLGVSPSTVRVQLHRFRQRVQSGRV